MGDTFFDGAAGGIYATEYMDSGDDRTCGLPFCPEDAPLLPAANREIVESKLLGAGQYPRLVSRGGETNVVHYDTRSRKILGQMGFMFHVLIGMRAWKLVLLFFLSYLTSYLILGGILFLTHDTSPKSNDFHGVHTYWEAVVFMAYTMTTVGFGNQYPKHPQASILPLMSVVFGLLMDAFWLGVIFARIASPRPLRHTVLFSQNAVLYKSGNDQRYTLSCRLVNLRVRYPWVDLSIKMSLVLFDQANMKLKVIDLKTDEECSPFFDLPYEVNHVVTNDSPLARLVDNKELFEVERGEVIVELNGQDPITGNCMKKRFSYISNEIVQDATFTGVLRELNSNDEEGYEVDLTKFHDMHIIAGPEAVGKAAVAGGTYGTSSTTKA